MRIYAHVNILCDMFLSDATLSLNLTSIVNDQVHGVLVQNKYNLININRILYIIININRILYISSQSIDSNFLTVPYFSQNL